MKTIILPGYSSRNKEWAEEVKANLHLKHEVLIHEWRHWQIPSSLSLSYELEKIKEEVGKERVNVLGKSVGARLAAHLMPEIRDKVEKVILCGIAGTSEEAREAFKLALEDFPPEKVVIFQNENDPMKSYEEIERFVHSINKKIKVVKKERSDHHYPYVEDFQKFFELG